MTSSSEKASFDDEDLLEAARTFAKEVILDYESLRWRLLPLHAGAATEFLAKAALARRSPLLLADASGNLGKTLVELSKSSGADDHSVRTVSLGEALARLRSIHPEFKVKDTDVKLLTASRNAAVHLGAETSQALPLVLTFTRVCNSLLSLMQVTTTWFWGAAKDAARIAQAQRPEVPTADAEIRLALARSKTREESYRALRNARSEVFAKLPLRHNEELNGCPICQCTARYEGTHEKDGDGLLIFTPTALTCHGCMLRLSDHDSLSRAGVQPSWLSPRGAEEIQQLFDHRE